jgi:polysaccharide biosynthesis/export protein
MRSWTLLLGVILAARVVPTAAAAQNPAAGNYVIGPKDVVIVTIYGQRDLTDRTFTVDADGKFSFPMIGRVQAAGLTAMQLEEALRTKLTPDYFRNPQISVGINKYLSKEIIVAGEVAQPGPQPFTAGMTLLGVLARAGGVTSSASGEVLVTRGRALKTTSNGGVGDGQAGGGTDGGNAAFDGVRVDLTKLQAGARDLDIEIHDGDTILVPRAESAYVLGEVKYPGPCAVQKNATVQQILSLAGGMTSHASRSNISIDREGKTLNNVKLTEFVKPGDTITVSARFVPF